MNRGNLFFKTISTYGRNINSNSDISRILNLRKKTKGKIAVDLTDNLVLLFKEDTQLWRICEELGVLKKLFKARLKEENEKEVITKNE